MRVSIGMLSIAALVAAGGATTAAQACGFHEAQASAVPQQLAQANPNSGQASPAVPTYPRERFRRPDASNSGTTGSGATSSDSGGSGSGGGAGGSGSGGGAGAGGAGGGAGGGGAGGGGGSGGGGGGSGQ